MRAGGVLLLRAALFAGLAAALVTAVRVSLAGLAAVRPPRAFTVLVLGADGGRLEGNTDTIVLARVDPRQRRLAALWIPRDTRVSLPVAGHVKINAANPLGGPDLAVAAVEDLVGTKVDHYVLTDFEAVARAIDRLGGVEVDVPQAMHYDDPTQDLHIHLKKGRQHLTGDQAVGFARFRSVALGDIARTGFQQALVAALLERVRTPEGLARLPGAAREVWDRSRSSLGWSEAARLIPLARGGWTLTAGTLPGAFLTVRGISYWGVDPARARAAWSDLLLGVTHPALEEGAPPGGAGTPARGGR